LSVVEGESRSKDGDEVSRDRGPRRRRRPEEAERTILAAGRAFLEEHPFREMTVEGIMVRTGLSRPAFYAYFKDRYDLVTRLIEGVGGLIFALDWRWLSGKVEGDEGQARSVLVEALRGGSQAFVEYGPVLRAISDAAGYDARVEEVYRGGLIERLIAAVSGRIARDVDAGITPVDTDPEQTARALVLMTERYLLDAFGRPERRPSPAEMEVVFVTLEGIWVRTLYGPA
jgi:TetR/AcrR family transcriptional regulator, ethionamide resistance regulator